ncbi:hypothetical protein EFP18_26885 [Burkholderia glumae]|nr:hypothetical protein EFP18_26885 [Burkholderia glumae]
MAVWRCGGVAVWRCGGVAVWRCGGMEAAGRHGIWLAPASAHDRLAANPRPPVAPAFWKSAPGLGPRRPSRRGHRRRDEGVRPHARRPPGARRLARRAAGRGRVPSASCGRPSMRPTILAIAAGAALPRGAVHARSRLALYGVNATGGHRPRRHEAVSAAAALSAARRWRRPPARASRRTRA